MTMKWLLFLLASAAAAAQSEIINERRSLIIAGNNNREIAIRPGTTPPTTLRIPPNGGTLRNFIGNNNDNDDDVRYLEISATISGRPSLSDEEKQEIGDSIVASYNSINCPRGIGNCRFMHLRSAKPLPNPITFYSNGNQITSAASSNQLQTFSQFPTTANHAFYPSCDDLDASSEHEWGNLVCFLQWLYELSAGSCDGCDDGEPIFPDNPLGVAPPDFGDRFPIGGPGGGVPISRPSSIKTTTPTTSGTAPVTSASFLSTLNNNNNGPPIITTSSLLRGTARTQATTTTTSRSTNRILVTNVREVILPTTPSPVTPSPTPPPTPAPVPPRLPPPELPLPPRFPLPPPELPPRFPFPPPHLPPPQLPFPPPRRFPFPPRLPSPFPRLPPRLPVTTQKPPQDTIEAPLRFRNNPFP